MKIGLIQTSSQKEKNKTLEHYLNEAINSNDELINFGIYPDSKIQLSYVQVSLAIALLINSRSLDFVVTGCTSGQGMMLACKLFLISNVVIFPPRKMLFCLAILTMAMWLLFPSDLIGVGAEKLIFRKL